MYEWSFIIRFDNTVAREQFVNRLRDDPIAPRVDYAVGEFLPDVIVRNVPDDFVSHLKNLVGDQGIVIPDEQHGLMTG